MLELSFEKEVVKTLTTGSNQWVERKDRYGTTPDQLWANFRDKLNNNNYAKLQGYPLTDTEFNQVKRAIEVRTPYEAAKLLATENGIGKHGAKGRQKISNGNFRKLHLIGFDSCFKNRLFCKFFCKISNVQIFRLLGLFDS